MAVCTPSICVRILSVAFAVWLARTFTSEATTANPLPASPARAASMVAFSASRFVLLARALISATTSPIRPAAAAKPSTVLVVRWAAAAGGSKFGNATLRHAGETRQD
jgi:hypothetical protein